MPDQLSPDDPKRATQLAILGIVCRAPTEGTMIVSLVKHIVGRAWQPTSDVIAQCLADLTASGLVRPEGGGRAWDTVRHTITSDGRAMLDRLLRAPIGAAPTPAAIPLKVCFLDLLPPDAQHIEVAGILGWYDREIAHMQEAIRRCACDWPHVPGWLGLEAASLEAQRDWFRQLAASLPVPA